MRILIVVLESDDAFQRFRHCDSHSRPTAVVGNATIAGVDDAVAVLVFHGPAGACGDAVTVRFVTFTVSIAVRAAVVDHQWRGAIGDGLRGEGKVPPHLIRDVVVGNLEHQAAWIQHQVLNEGRENLVVTEHERPTLRHQRPKREAVRRRHLRNQGCNRYQSRGIARVLQQCGDLQVLDGECDVADVTDADRDAHRSAFDRPLNCLLISDFLVRGKRPSDGVLGLAGGFTGETGRPLA